MKLKVQGLGIFLISTALLMTPNYKLQKTSPQNIPVIEEDIIDKDNLNQIPETKTITISAIGDCTLGSDTKFGYGGSFYEAYDQYGPTYFFEGVRDILSQDDITIANLETTFTTATERLEKTFNFKGPQEYTDILKDGSVDIVNVANNHTHDYKEIGFQDTLRSLEEAKIPYFGYTTCSIQEVKDIKIGFFGLYNNHNLYSDIKTNIDYLKEQGADLIIASFHWGTERDYQQNNNQQALARYAIDNGCDLVLGHHPHVIQGIEQYQGKYIVYSLANFVFGGHKNPKDKDTFIYRQTFTFENKELVSTDIHLIPTSISSLSTWNDYQPTILEDNEKDRVLAKILTYSNIEYTK